MEFTFVATRIVENYFQYDLIGTKLEKIPTRVWTVVAEVAEGHNRLILCQWESEERDIETSKGKIHLPLLEVQVLLLDDEVVADAEKFKPQMQVITRFAKERLTS